MKSGPFITLLSDALRVQRKTLAIYDRALKEGGLVTTGARGVNAPDVTPRDAARITLGLLATASPKASVEAVERIGRFRLSDAATPAARSPEAVFGVQPGHCLDDVLTCIFSMERDYARYAADEVRSHETPGAPFLPPLSVAFHEAQQAVCVDYCGHEFVYVDAEAHRRARELSAMIRDLPEGDPRFEDLMSERRALLDRLIGDAPGLRVTREVTGAEIIKISRGLFPKGQEEDG